MIRRARQPLGLSRHVFLTLAALAVALKVMIPPGFMAAAPSNDLPFAIVLCTGQGAITVDAGQVLPGHEGRDQAPAKGVHDSPCAFAGHGVGAGLPALHKVERAQFVAYLPLAPTTPPSLAPGRGLAGPPLPARGPPSLLI
ncbi:MAG: hypothetical protein WCY15_01895 [Phenylobacterium sp.]|jgi:hypothetical protein|uniref:hypothetical protein n=1 Tax=Phenylobacterium sp. TaxID=1871053 RepID=UPI002A323814|nr:hypothetical protein [Phenylobacterium sp.]MDD3838621.1 hypothetical protein [Phenylobacterium sp.]MDX9999349.1 hypothetical protein [Phenylobacterium sp.]